MSSLKKLIVCGVGGQGVTYTVRLLMSAAVLANIKVSTDEIHGLSQRGGVVNAGLTFGESGHGYVAEGEADYLIGLEKLEAQRCISFLKADSRTVIDNTEITPFTVNAGLNKYPNTDDFVSQLQNLIAEVKYINHSDEISRKFRKFFVLGVASTLGSFPIKSKYIEQAIINVARANTANESVRWFKLGREY
jgi:indolepyruvate ferredoxin oxidoreductase beta subunit